MHGPMKIKFKCSVILGCVVWSKPTDVLEERSASFSRVVFFYTLIMQAAGSSETSVHFYRTALCHNPPSSIPHIRRSYNRKPQTSGLHDSSPFSLLQAGFSLNA